VDIVLRHGRAKGRMGDPEPENSIELLIERRSKDVAALTRLQYGAITNARADVSHQLHQQRVLLGWGGWSQMSKCIGFKPDGSLCQGVAKRGSDWCPSHDPARKDARRRSASKAARSKPGREIGNLKAQLAELAENVLNATVEPKVGAVVTQIFNARIKLIDCERRIKEADELEAKIEEIQNALERSGGGSRGEA
jgi:hypothetical protein